MTIRFVKRKCFKARNFTVRQQNGVLLVCIFLYAQFIIYCFLYTKKDYKQVQMDKNLVSCQYPPKTLQGATKVSLNLQPLSIATIEENNPLVLDGGHYKPVDCLGQKVAIIIPYRNRETHLRYFLQFMHPILQRQQLEYKVYVINQSKYGKFNRAKLLNIGYKEASKDLQFDCFVFHDVDMILLTDKVMYTCSDAPRHLSGHQNTGYFGGVTQLNKTQMEKINGFSNIFWGWGGEDDDMLQRIYEAGMMEKANPSGYRKYLKIEHEPDIGNEKNLIRKKLVKDFHKRMPYDGLNNLDYGILNRESNKLFTRITVDII